MPAFVPCVVCFCLRCPTVDTNRTALSPEPKPYEVPPSLLARWQFWAGILSVALILLGLGVLSFNWPNRPNEITAAPTNNSEQPKPPVEDKPAPAKTPEPTPVLVMGPPVELKTPPFLGPPEELKAPPFIPAKRPIFMGPPENLKPPLPPARNPVVVAGVTKLDDPEGEYVVETVNNRTVKLTGVVKRLKVGEVMNHGFLDASELVAKEIVIVRAIRSDSSVRLNAPNGKVEFGGPINSRCKVFIIAPNGAVTFKANGAQVLGEAKLTIVAGCVDFQDRVQGWSTMVLLTLSSGGSLKFKEITGGAKVHYKRANPKDPDLDILAGSVHNQSELKKLD